MRPSHILAVGLAVAAFAQAAAAATPYDGSYVGTASVDGGSTNGSARNHACVPFAAPAPLTIANGHAETLWAGGPMQGDVNPQGHLVMHSSLAGRFEGQVDAGGTLKGVYQGACIYTLTWQRRR